MEFFKDPIDPVMITELDPDESFLWMASLISKNQLASSEMPLSTPQMLRASRSVAIFGSKLAACRSTSKELQSRFFSASDSDSSLSDMSDDDHPFNYSSDAGISELYHYNPAVEEESERIWSTWDDLPTQTDIKSSEKCATRHSSQEIRPRIDDCFVLSSPASETDVHQARSIYRSDAVRSPPGRDLIVPSAPLIPSGPKFLSLTPSPSPSPPRTTSLRSSTPSPTIRSSPSGSFISPSPSPSAKDPINYSHPQHTSLPVNTAYNVTPPLRTHASTTSLPARARAKTVLSQPRPRHHSKLSTCTTNGEYPLRTRSIPHYSVVDSRPPSPDFPLSDNLMGKMQESFFEDSDDDEDEKADLPDWIKRLYPRKGNAHKDPFSKAMADFAGKQKKKSKSFGGFGEVLKRSLKIRRSCDF